MLSEWYFCCCIRSSPDKTFAYLSMLETLHNSESNDQLILLTLDELRRTDIWMQIYAAPHLLTLLRRDNVSETLIANIRTYFNNLFDVLDQKTGAALFRLLESLISSKQIDRNELAACLRLIKRTSDVEPGQTPYIDLKDFLPETLLLAFIANQLVQDRSLAIKLLGELTNTTNEVALLVEDALNYRFGRLAFLLAVRILLHKDEDRQELLSTIWHLPEAVVEMEPDLLYACAEVLFTSSTSEKRSEMLNFVLQELNSFTQLRRLLRNYPRNVKLYDTFLSRIGYQSTKPLSEVLPFVYWQSVLWLVATNIDDVAAAHALAEHWQMPPIRQGTIYIKTLTRVDEIDNLKALYTALMRLHRPDSTNIQVGRDKKFAVPKWSRPLFFSPWLSPILSSTERGPKMTDGRYHEIRNAATLIRLVTGVFLSVRLLQCLEKDALIKREFAALIVHAADVLSAYRAWFREHTDEETEVKGPRLPLEITGWAKFGHRQITLAGCGHIASIDPDTFLTLPFQFQSIEDESDADGAYQYEYFRRKVLPQVMISWCTDAIQSATYGSSAARWLEKISDVYDNYQNGWKSQSTIFVRFEAALLVRFLYKEYKSKLSNELHNLDWRQAKDKRGRMLWRVGHRQLLLTMELPADEWVRPDWNEADLNRASRLVLALERLAALKQADGIGAEQIKQWSTTWIDELNEIAEPKEMDRFVRLRLLELIDDPVLQHNLEGQELIALILLEYGSAYDLSCLFDRVFALEHIVEKMTNTTRQKVRLSLLKAMQREIELHTERREQRFVPQDPLQIHCQLQRVEIIEAAIEQIAWRIRYQAEFSDLQKFLYEQMRAKLGGRPSSSHAITNGKVSLNQRFKQINLAASAPPLVNWMVRAAVFDPNTLTTQLYTEELDLETIITEIQSEFGADRFRNLFQESPKEVRIFMDSRGTEPIYLFAIVLCYDDMGEGRYCYTFNCGLTFYPIQTRRGLFNNIQPGDYIAMPLHWDTTTGRWLIPYNYDLYKFPLRSDKREIKELKVKEYYGGIPLSISHASTEIEQELVDPFLWDPDPSRRFRRTYKRVNEYVVYAALDASGKWLPIDQGLREFVLRVFIYADKRIAVLTLSERDVIGAFGAKGWRFSSRPGENYVLYQRYFAEEDAKAITEMIEQWQEPTGLLVALTASVADGVFRLHLQRQSIDDPKLEQDYPNLMLPFDDRNIRWRNLFTDADLLVARRIESDWVFDLNESLIPGYPQYIRIDMDWHNHRPPVGNTEVEFSVTLWNDKQQRLAIVKGEVLRINRITPHNKNYHAFFERWLNLQPGDPLYLRRTIGKTTPDGYIKCLTDENVSVDVECETISMQPGATQTQQWREVRTAVVHAVTWLPGRVTPLLDIEALPEEISNSDNCLALLTQVPDRADGGTLCRVLWKIDSTFKDGQIQISNLNDPGMFIYPGCFLEGEVSTTGEWKFCIRSPRILVRGLWRQRAWNESIHNACWLGVINRGEYAGRAITEIRPGEFALLPEHLEHKLPFTNIGNAELKGLRPDQKLKHTCGNRTWKEAGAGSKYCRSALLWNGKLISGICAENTPTGDVSLIEANYSVTKVDQNQDWFVLRRFHRLRPWVQQMMEKQIEVKAPLSNTKQKEQLEAYLASPRNLAAIYQKNSVTLHDFEVPKVHLSALAGPEQIQWTKTLAIDAVDREYIFENDYTVDALVRLVEYNGYIRASFRHAKPYSPEDYRELTGAEWNVLVELEASLYYVGPVNATEIDPNTGMPYAEIYHRFEWGFGKLLLAPESQLRFNDKPFDRTQLLLYYGDKITHITFVPETVDNETGIGKTTSDIDHSVAEGSEAISTRCHLIIRDIHLQFSEARMLFTQRTQYKLVHLLHLSAHLLADDAELHIDYIESFDEAGSDKSHRFSKVHPRLTTDSQQRLLARLRSEDDHEEMPARFIILGRMKEDEFRNSFGTRCVFEHVYLSFRHSTSPDQGVPLQENERIFLQVGKMIPVRNDIALELLPLDSLHRSDIGADFRSNLLLRRQFSVREDSLRRIHEEKGYLALKGATVLVLVRSRDPERANASMIDGMPDRKIRALSVAITSGNGMTFATVVKAQETGIRIELSPGVFVWLHATQIDIAPKGTLLANLEPGSIIRIESLLNYRFFVMRATFGDVHYVPITRPVVVLPKNELLRKNVWDENVDSDRFWQRKKLFTIGGLPNIEAIPGMFDDRTGDWLPARARDFTSLMEMPHPKIAWLGQDKEGSFRIDTDTVDLPVGRLEQVNKTLSVTFVGLDGNARQLLQWSLLSFGDEPAHQLLGRARLEKWKYHDDSTGYWVGGDAIKIVAPEPHTAFTGPLFFERDHENDQLRLRYSVDRFRRYGFRVDEIIRALSIKEENGKKRSHIYPVAGISEGGGLWIELSPGRIAELPAQLMVWQANGQEKSILHFHWQSFAAGDRVELESISTSPLTMVRVALRNWNPGPRNAFGSCCFLMAHRYNSQSGFIALGDGEFKLQYPLTEPRFQEQLVVLNQDNHLFAATNVKPQKDDVVMLGTTDNHQPSVIGFPGMTPASDRQNPSVWMYDPLADLIRSQLPEVIRAVGGALPVTVEYIDRNGILYFSRRIQSANSHLPNGAITFGRIIGHLPDEQTVMIRFGASIFPAQIDQIVSGLPKRFFAAAIKALQGKVLLWIQQHADKIKFSLDEAFAEIYSGTNVDGVNVDALHEIDVEVVATIETEQDNKIVNGLLCRHVETFGLYWLPGNYAGWANLTTQQLERVFQEKGKRVFPVMLRQGYRGKTAWISRIDVRLAKKELEKLEIGEELSVRVIEKIVSAEEDSIQRYLVESTTAKIVLECEVYDDLSFETDQQIPVEVVKRVNGYPSLVTTCPIGKRRYYLDLPSSFLYGLPSPGQYRSSFQSFITFMQTEPSDVRLSEMASAEGISFDDVKLLDDAKLNEWLSYAYIAPLDRQDMLCLQAHIASTWMRRYRDQAEIDLHFSLMAILLLDRCRSVDPRRFLGQSISDIRTIEKLQDEWLVDIFSMTHGICLRAIRSIHVDVLNQLWLANTNNRLRKDNLWRRLQQLLPRLRAELTMQDIHTIRQFCRSVQLREQKDLLPVADALLAAIGELALRPVIYPESENGQATLELVHLLRAMPLTSITSQAGLHSAHLDVLEDIFKLIISQAIDLTLLEPLPKIEVAQSS